MKRKYIFVTDEKADDYDVLSDFEIEKDNTLDLHIAKHSPAKTAFGKKVHRVYFSGKVNYYLPLPFQYKTSEISKYKFEKNMEYVLIVFVGSLGQYDYRVWNKLKKQNKNVHLVLILWDSYNVQTFFGKMFRRDIKKVDWDYIFSFDKNDAEQYGFKYLNEHYYSDKRRLIKKDGLKKWDVYFVSTIKPGKGKIIKEIYKHLIKNGVRCNFEILLRTLEDKMTYAKDTTLEGVNFYYELKPYRKVLEELQSTSCILEVLQEKQTAPSLRYFEAVMFNKKLLTNNPYVKDLNFYDERYMKYFEKIDDIDIEWLKAKEVVDYHYKDEFSPKHLLKEIMELYGD